MDENPHLSQARLYAPLSAREREILRLLAEDRSDREIADQLIVAPTTVKWYNRQIFNKLGVNNRREAVDRARILGLLATDSPADLPRHNLPGQMTPFVGRLHELDDLQRMLSDPHHRLITLLAPGGMGKTRLALAAGELVLPRFADGVFFVALAPVTAVEQIVPAIADAVGFQFFSDTRPPRQQLLDYVRAKRLLLVLDNFEHLLEGTALVVDILHAAPELKVLVTSRERLNVNGETVYSLEGLNYPAGIAHDHAEDYAAVELFITSAQRASPRFTLESEAVVVRICHLVQGMPLALELAAAWVSSLSLNEIAAEIERSADFLRTSMRNVPERLRSVRAVFDAAWRQLSEPEQRVFRRLSIFRGGFTRDAAQVVTGADVVVLAALVDKALIWWHSDQSRYDLHELLRQYAAQELETVGESETVREAHRAHYAQWMQQSAALKTRQHMNALMQLDADVENIREAFRYAIEVGTPDVLEPFGDVWYYYEIRGWWVEGEQLFGAAIERLEPNESVALAKLLAGHVVCLERLGRLEQWPALARRSVDILRTFGAQQGNLSPFWYIGIEASTVGDRDEANVIYHEVLAMARQDQDPWATAIVLYLIGLNAFYQHQSEQAKIYLKQSLTMLIDLDNEWGMSYPCCVLGDLACMEQDYEDAVQLYEKGLVHARKAGHPNMIEGCLSGLANVAVARQDWDLARHLEEDVLDLRRDSGRIPSVVQSQVSLAEISLRSGAYDQARKDLRDALWTGADMAVSALLYPFQIAAELLFELGIRQQAVEIFSFVQNHPDHKMLFYTDPEYLQKLTARFRTALPLDAYNTAWERGKTRSVNDVRTMILTNL